MDREHGECQHGWMTTKSVRPNSIAKKKRAALMIVLVDPSKLTLPFSCCWERSKSVIARRTTSRTPMSSLLYGWIHLQFLNFRRLKPTRLQGALLLFSECKFVHWCHNQVIDKIMMRIFEAGVAQLFEPVSRSNLCFQIWQNVIEKGVGPVLGLARPFSARLAKATCRLSPLTMAGSHNGHLEHLSIGLDS